MFRNAEIIDTESGREAREKSKQMFKQKLL